MYCSPAKPGRRRIAVAISLDPRRGSGALMYMKASVSTYFKMKSTTAKLGNTPIPQWDVTHGELNDSRAGTDIGLVKDEEGRTESPDMCLNSVIVATQRADQR